MRIVKKLQDRKEQKISAADLREYKNQSPVGTIGTNDMDTMADTCCAGSNWTPIYFTGETVEVSPFADSYESMKDIPVATCATIIVTESGAKYLLVGHEMLYFGNALRRSLINPNQLRMAGIKVVDDPTVDDGFGIHTHELFIPFRTHGTTIYFDSLAPSQKEIEDMAIPHIQITDPEPWNPHTVKLRSNSPTPNLPIENVQIHQVASEPRAIELYTQIADLGQEHMYEISPAMVSQELDRRIIQSVKVSKVLTEKRHSEVTPTEIAKKFHCSLETAQRTLTMTTQKGIRTALHPLTKRYRVDHLFLNRRKLPGRWQTDVMFSKVKSLEGHTCSNVITNGRYTRVHPLSSKKHVAVALHDMERDVGTPMGLRANLAGEYLGKNTEWIAACKKYHIKMDYGEKGRKNQLSMVEREIGELKKRWRRRMTEKDIPARLWDRGLKHDAEVLSLLSRGNGQRPGIEEITGQTKDISDYCDFDFYDLVWYYPGSGSKLDLIDDARLLGRWIGVSHRVGSDLCYDILTAAGHIVSNTTVQHVIRTDYENASTKARIDEFNRKLKERLDDTNFGLPAEEGLPYWQDEDPPEVYARGLTPDEAEYGNHWGQPVYEPDTVGETEEAIDKYIGAQIMDDLDGSPTYGVVQERATDLAGNKVGRPHRNPLLDTREYVVKYPDDTTRRLTANQIAQAIYSQVDSEGNSYNLIEEIIGHRKDGKAVTKENGFWISKSGNRTPKKTTAGWQICLQYKTGEISWHPLKDVKDSNPVELAEYAVKHRIDDEPAFRWWVPLVLRSRERIIAKVKKRYWATTHKYGIRLPKSVGEALEIDRNTGTDFWAKAIQKERDKVRVAWQAMDGHTPAEAREGKVEALRGYQEIDCHMVFDVKMDFTRKARFVAGGHTTSAPTSITYSSVVSRDSVRILLTIAALNAYDVFACDVNNAYLNAPCREKIW
jgi:hypothetical protein